MISSCLRNFLVHLKDTPKRFYTSHCLPVKLLNYFSTVMVSFREGQTGITWRWKCVGNPTGDKSRQTLNELVNHLRPWRKLLWTFFFFKKKLHEAGGVNPKKPTTEYKLLWTLNHVASLQLAGPPYCLLLALLHVQPSLEPLLRPCPFNFELCGANVVVIQRQRGISMAMWY